MCLVNDGVLHPLLVEEDVWKGVLDLLNTNVVGLIGDGLESWDSGVEVGKQNWEMGAEEAVELLGSPVQWEGYGSVCGLSNQASSDPMLEGGCADCWALERLNVLIRQDC